jgi:lipopolysaccharide biosynthesis regulator YciM
MVDKVNAKKLAEQYGEVLAALMVEKFFHLVKFDPSWRKKSVTLGSLFFHRNDLQRFVKEDLQKNSQSMVKDEDEF